MTAGPRKTPLKAPAAIALTIVLLAVFSGLASAGKSQPASGNAAARSTFKLQCSSCHGQSGAGDTSVGKSLNAADLRSAGVQKQSDAQLAQVISEGRKNMPSFSDSLTQDQIQALVAYIRRLAKSQK
ncbi:MAG: c-type cytochrome [Terriglobales bacterium]